MLFEHLQAAWSIATSSIHNIDADNTLRTPTIHKPPQTEPTAAYFISQAAYQT